MIMLYLGMTLGTIGKIILGVAVLRVHGYIMQERKIDTAVLRAMRTERYVTAFGLLLIVTGYIVELIFFSGN